MAAEYVSVDEWNVDAPIEAVVNAIAHARTYTEWWKPVYISAEGDCTPAVGCRIRQYFKGRLPYKIRMTSEIVHYDPPRQLEARVTGDLTGRGVWTLTPTGRGVHVRLDWRGNGEKPLLRVLTPLLHPLFRWNHNCAVKCLGSDGGGE